MFTNLQFNCLSRLVFLLFFSIFFSLNTYAVKKSAAEETAHQLEKASVVLDEKEKPSLVQRLGLKLLIKKLKKNAKKLTKNQKGTKGESDLNQKMAITALVLGIVTFVVPFVSIVTAILAIIFGAIAKKRATEQPEVYGGKGMANAGMIL